MDFTLKPEQVDIRDRVRRFCEEEVMPRAQEHDLQETFPQELVGGLGKLGLLGVLFPKGYGGLGLDHLTYCLVLEELGRADASVALTVESHNSLCSNTIYLAGNEAQKKKYLTRLAKGEVLGAWALTEPGAGSDAASLKTQARLNGSEWVLNGSKTFTTQGSVGGVYVIFAQTDERRGGAGITAFLAEKGAPGLEVGKVERKMGIRASDTAQLHITNLRLPQENVLGEVGKGFRYAMRILDGGRIGISAVSVGIARGALEEGLKWVKSHRKDFRINGDPGLTYAQKLLADLASEIDAARLMVHRAAWLADTGRPFGTEASMAKLLSGELCMKATTQVVDLFGEFGGTLDCPVQRYFRDAKLYQIGEGSTQIQELIISRHLLSS